MAFMIAPCARGGSEESLTVSSTSTMLPVWSTVTVFSCPAANISASKVGASLEVSLTMRLSLAPRLLSLIVFWTAGGRSASLTLVSAECASVAQQQDGNIHGASNGPKLAHFRGLLGLDDGAGAADDEALGTSGELERYVKGLVVMPFGEEVVAAKLELQRGSRGNCRRRLAAGKAGSGAHREALHHLAFRAGVEREKCAGHGHVERLGGLVGELGFDDQELPALAGTDQRHVVAPRRNPRELDGERRALRRGREEFLGGSGGENDGLFDGENAVIDLAFDPDSGTRGERFGVRVIAEPNRTLAAVGPERAILERGARTPEPTGPFGDRAQAFERSRPERRESWALWGCP